jgi:hypothetical protein
MSNFEENKTGFTIICLLRSTPEHRLLARRYPTRAAIEAGLAQPVELVPVPIPLTCQDGFNEAYYGRPEMLLDPGARTSCSAWSFVAPETADAYVAYLAQDLASGAWDANYGTLRTAPFYHGSLYLFVAR